MSFMTFKPVKYSVFIPWRVIFPCRGPILMLEKSGRRRTRSRKRFIPTEMFSLESSIMVVDTVMGSIAGLTATCGMDVTRRVIVMDTVCS